MAGKALFKWIVQPVDMVFLESHNLISIVKISRVLLEPGCQIILLSDLLPFNFESFQGKGKDY